MADNELLSMAQQFSGLPMGDLIGGPLQAAAQANAMMAVTQTKFLLDTCFSKDDKDNYQPIMIKMKLLRGVISAAEPTKDNPTPEPNIKTVETSFDLPLLTIIPLNSLGVDNVDIGFNMEVKSSFSENTSQATQKKLAAESSFEAKIGYGIFSASIKGSVSYDQTDSSSRDTHYEKSNSANYTVKVHAGQLPLPLGVTTIIDAFTKSITPIQMPIYKGDTKPEQ